MLSVSKADKQYVGEKKQYDGRQHERDKGVSRFFHLKIVPSPGRLRYTSRPRATPLGSSAPV